MSSENDHQPVDIGIIHGILLELESTINARVAADATPSEVSSILMSWCNDQIKQDVITQSEYLLEGFVRLLRFPEIGPFSLEQVDEVFTGWLEMDAVQNSAYRRRYLIVQQDVRRLYAAEARRGEERTQGFKNACISNQRGKGPPVIIYGQENDDAKSKETATNLVQHTNHSIPSGVLQTPQLSDRSGLAAVDQLFRPNISTSTDATTSQELHDIPAQNTTADDMAISLETTVVDSMPSPKMPQKSSRATRRSYKHKVPNESPEPTAVPKNYICKRCHEPGHLIQYCPTNVDPRYDHAPARDYQCNFCGTKGHHFATLCSSNPHESSLMKQRENLVIESPISRTSNRSSARHYKDGEHFRGRHQSRSPTARCSRDHYRSRSPQRFHPQQGKIDVHSSGVENEYDENKAQLQKEKSLSPYARRVRLTQELYANPDTFKRGESLSQFLEDPFRAQSVSETPPLEHYHQRFSFKKQSPQRHRDLDRVSTVTNEGRLAYDDDTYDPIGTGRPASSTTGSLSRAVSISSIDEGEVTKVTPHCMVVTSEELAKAEIEAEDFLRMLAAEIMSKGNSVPLSRTLDTLEAETGMDDHYAMEVHNDSSDESSHTTLKHRPVVVCSASHLNRRQVHCPPFSPKIVSMFNTRENPIVNVAAARKTACEMMNKCEGLQTSQSVQTVERVAPTSLKLYHESAKTKAEEAKA